MKNKIGFLIAGFSLFSGFANGQQDPLFTQYLDNQIYVNPAFAGSKENMEITGIHRQQWFGFSGAPMTTTLSLHTPLKYKSIGLGLDLMNDNIGPLNRTNVSIDFAYRIHFKNESKLSFGIKAGGDFYNGDLTTIDQSGTDALANRYSDFTPSFGAGVYYFAPKWFLGASVPRLTSNLSGNVGGLDSAKHVFGIAGALFSLTNKWELRPTTQVRYTAGTPLSADLTLTGIYNSKFWIGLNYRLKESAGGFVQFKITKQLKIGYAYDFPLTEIRTGTAGSHEIMLSFGLIKTHKGLVSPRYF